MTRNVIKIIIFTSKIKNLQRMTHTTRKVFASFVTGALALASVQVQAQCTSWTNPSSTSGWNDFTSMFNGAPVAGDDGCPVNEITDFEVYADEAYEMANIVAGTSYTFSACNGTGGTAWDLYFTIINPSGEVDAFGLNAGSTCELTWEASESGSYLIVVSEAGACGNSTNDGTSNGFPAITCGTPMGVHEANAGSFSISPNPTSGNFVIGLQGLTIGEDAMVEVRDLTGRTVYTAGINAGELTKHIDLSAQAAGSYFVTVRQAGRMVREKLVLANN